ncbi:MAG: lysozyme family protein, partial [Parabacteroides sp.]|nr:lysozyme family protein [Parabacteroides sp.]
MTNAWNDNAVMMQNIQRYQTAVWSAIDEAHDDLLREIHGLAEEGEEITIIDDFNFSSVNTTLILCQYCAAKGTDEVNVEDLASVISSCVELLFHYTETGSNTYTVRYVGDAYFADHIFKLTDEQKELAEMYASNLELFLHGSRFGSVSAQVSDDVLKYGALVEKYAQKYGISHFVDVINAVMMAESGGRVPDVMQASECPYNKKYPNEPNGITDLEYSIEVGVHYLADCLKGAGCTAPTQTEKLSLALQGYNYGNGYISWAIENYGGYTEANAQEFSRIMQKKLGWSGYGNPKYVSAVFKYLVFSGNGIWGSPFVGKNWNSAVSSEFGWRTDPLNGSKAFHEGLDSAYPTGTEINAISGGVVTSVVYSKTGYGNHIRVDCGDGVTVLYAHCSDIFVTKGQSIAA